MMAWIVALYLVEYETANANLLGSPAHGLLRKEKSEPVLASIFTRLEANQNTYPPKSQLGSKAIGYMRNQ